MGLIPPIFYSLSNPYEIIMPFFPMAFTIFATESPATASIATFAPSYFDISFNSY